MQILGIIFELLSFITALVMGIGVLQKNKDYLGNKLMALGCIFIGVYPFSVAIYDIWTTEFTVQIFLRVGMIGFMFGSIFIYFTLQTMLHSQFWFDKKINWVAPLVIGAVNSLYLIFTDFIEIVDLTGNVNNRVDPIPLAIILGTTFIFTLVSTIKLYHKGIKHSHAQSKYRMKFFFAGLVVNIGTMVVAVASNLIENAAIESILDLSIFLVLAVGLVLMAIGFANDNKEKPEHLK